MFKKYYKMTAIIEGKSNEGYVKIRTLTDNKTKVANMVREKLSRYDVQGIKLVRVTKEEYKQFNGYSY